MKKTHSTQKDVPPVDSITFKPLCRMPISTSYRTFRHPTANNSSLLKPDSSSCQHSTHTQRGNGGMGRVSPVGLALSTERSRYACDAANDTSWLRDSASGLTACSQARSCGLPLALSTPGHGDFPHSRLRSMLLVCALRSRASPASMSLKRFTSWMCKFLSVMTVVN